MENIPQYVDQQSSDVLKTMDVNKNECNVPVIKNEKSDSDANCEDDSSTNEQSSVNSQFYETSDSKIDYAVKLDDNDTLSDIDDIKTDTASADSEDSALGSLPSDIVLNDREDDGQDRSDGSDSGIGSETTEDVKLSSYDKEVPNENDQNNKDAQFGKYNVNKMNNKSDTDNIQPRRSSLKRKCDEENNDETRVKRKKSNIQFNNVTVYYFPRAQGFSCVPSQGGSTLGMEWEHTHSQKFTLAEHALEQRRLHRQILQQLKNERNSEQGVPLSSSEDSDTEEETSDISESELDLDSYYFLQPVPTRQRRALLRAAGVRKIEGFEKDECRDIRTSREFCGCACKGTCNPLNCSCSIAGIKCQVDRLNFPCGCTRDGCSNTTGRIEFNPIRVRTHFINTLMRIGLEKKNEENQEAAKRQWAETLNSNTTMPCLPNTSLCYETKRCNSTPGLSVQPCVSNTENLNNHCNLNNTTTTSIQGDPLYNYQHDPTSHRNIKSQNTLNFEDKSKHRNHDPYTSNILQGKGPPYPPSNTMEFNTNLQRYSCDLNYMYEQQSDGHQYKASQSYSASSFEEFAHNSQMTMFNHYGHMYLPEYVHKQNTSMTEHNNLHYHPMPQNHYDIYKSTAECASLENKPDPHYTNLLPYQHNNKLQTVENDENWFSHNTLLNLDNSDQITQVTPSIQSEPMQAPVEANVSDTTENLGELIKKTMVESVTV